MPVVVCWAVKAGLLGQVKVRLYAWPRGGWFWVVRLVQKLVRTGRLALEGRVVAGSRSSVPRRRMRRLRVMIGLGGRVGIYLKSV